MTTSAISLHDVHLTLGRGRAEVHVLRGVSLEIARGQSVAILGPSGSGKSTLLMVIAGLERADSGAITVSGTDLIELNEDELARFRGETTGIVFQSFHLIPTMTALENVAVPLELAMAAGKADAMDAFERARKELGAVSLGDRVEHYPSELSGGEQQRVALARALAVEPEILFADEPTGNLDGQTGGQIADLLFNAHTERGATLVLVTHDEALAARCDRVLRMADGAIVEDTAAPATLAAAS